MKPQLSKAGASLRDQVNKIYPDRDKTSDGWIGDTRHAATVSDHNPDANGWVRAIDVDRDLSGKSGKPDIMPYLADQLRAACLAKTEKRITYIIFDSRICSAIQNWKWRLYDGINKHDHHMHVSFAKEADNLGALFQVPMLTEKHA